jgi:hypothetical protein
MYWSRGYELRGMEDKLGNVVSKQGFEIGKYFVVLLTSLTRC